MDDRERGRKGAGRHHLIGESGIADDRERGKGREWMIEREGERGQVDII